MNPDVIDLQPQNDYTLRLIFAGGEVRDFDVRPYLDMSIFKELRDSSYFRQAYVEFGSVEWPHGQGLSYDTLYLESVSASMTAES
jgi:hypothetical protein